MKIIAIGGGHIGETIGGKRYPPDSATIYKEIVAISNKKHPTILFVSTASTDSEGYCKIISQYFKKFGCATTTLKLITEKPSIAKIKERISKADIIYVGGGNTLKMMNVWRAYGFDKLIIDAGKKGKILSGISAGAICWFRQGSSDSRKFTNKNAALIKVRGLNLYDLLYCPHYDAEADRRPQLKKMMKKTRGVAIACENCCALEIINNTYRIITPKKNANAYKCYWNKGKYYEEKISKTKIYNPLQDLLCK